MKRNLVTVTIVLISALCIVACDNSKKNVSTKQTQEVNDWTNSIEKTDSDIYYENSLGGKLTKDEYDKMILIYSRDSLKNMDKKTMELLKDDNLVGSTFDFYSDMHRGDDAMNIEFVDKKFKYSNEKDAVEEKFDIENGDFNIEMSGEEAVKRAKDETTLTDYNVVRLATCMNEKMYRVSFAKEEDSREFQRVYIGWNGLTVAITNVSVNDKWDERKLLFEPVTSYDSVMIFTKFNQMLEDKDYCNGTSIDISKEEFENMLIAYPEDEIFKMDKELLKDQKDNHEIVTETFDYNTDIQDIGDLISERVNIKSELSEKKDIVNRDKAIEIAKEEINIPFYYVKAAISEDGNIYRISFSLKENSKTFERVYVGKNGIIKDVVNVKYMGNNEDFVIS